MFIILILAVIWNLLLSDNKLFTGIIPNNHLRVCQKLYHGGFICLYLIFNGHMEPPFS